MTETTEPKKPTMRHFFLRDTSEFPVACIATERDGENILYALSICNPKDYHCFDPGRARTIARQRLHKFIGGGYVNQETLDPTKPKFQLAKVGTFSLANVEKDGNVKMALLRALGDNPDLPKHFREAVTDRVAILKEQAKRRHGQGGTATAPVVP